ncbi:MAG: spermidine/putrescine ABC transporter permease [Clostridiales bacterium]|nr:spermidine/putrescine ABC transporter permease [Clostridiales bacterium]
MKIVKRVYLGLILLFLYVPILVMIILSFNGGRSWAQWGGFSFQPYADLFANKRVLNPLIVTITIAILASLFSTIIGTLAAIGIFSMKRKPQSMMMTLTNIPMTMPDIVTGVSLLLLFIFLNIKRGYITMLLAHITFDVPYVIVSVLPKLKQMNKHSYEAALDLGATPIYSLFHVIIPEIAPGIVTGALLSFTLSIDDFTISYFAASGSNVQNLSTLIYSSARKGIKAELFALSTIMFVVMLVLLILINRTPKSEKAKNA